jgi:hypothetical protein
MELARRRMHRIVLTLVLALTSSPALSAGSGPLRTSPADPAEGFGRTLEQLPPQIAAAATAYVDECQGGGGSPSPTASFVRRVDLNDDGTPDYLVDTGDLNASCFCGSGGCAIEAWVAD